MVSEPSDSNPVGLSGAQQKQHAAVAVAALGAAKIDIAGSAIVGGLTNVRWPARFQRWDDRITIDGAHNPAGARVLAQTWRDTFGSERAAVILAILQDKNAAEMIRALLPLASRFIVAEARSERTMSAAELAAAVWSSGDDLDVSTARTLAEAVVQAGGDSRVLITGSLHFAGEALAHLRGEPAAFEESAQ